MRIVELASSPPGWISRTTPQEKIFFSRVTFLRNFMGYLFPSAADETELMEVRKRLRIIFENLLDIDGKFLNLEELTRLEVQLLKERAPVKMQFEPEENFHGIFLAGNEKLTAIVNAGNHLEIRATVGGLALKRALHMAESVEKAVGKFMEYAFDSTRGYLTTNPLDSGLAMRFSVVLHLPGIAATHQIDELSEMLGEVLIRMEPFFSNKVGNLFVFSTLKQLGVNEMQLYHSFAEVIDMILDLEDAARDTLLRKHPLLLEDRVSRAYALIKAARTLKFEEVAEFISILKLGAALGLFNSVPVARLDEILILSQPAHIKATFAEGDNFDEGALRAGFVKSMLKPDAQSTI